MKRKCGEKREGATRRSNLSRIDKNRAGRRTPRWGGEGGVVSSPPSLTPSDSVLLSSVSEVYLTNYECSNFIRRDKAAVTRSFILTIDLEGGEWKEGGGGTMVITANVSACITLQVKLMFI